MSKEGNFQSSWNKQKKNQQRNGDCKNQVENTQLKNKITGMSLREGFASRMISEHLINGR